MLGVYYQDQIVGHIEDENPGLSFVYNPGWIDLAEAGHSFAISLTMPIRCEPYPTAIATPWFANLLPEDRQLQQIGVLLGRGEGDVYGLLEEIGRDTAGALSIGEPESVDNADYRELTDEDLAHAIERLPDRPLLAGDEGVTMSLAGVQTKLPVAIFDGRPALPLNGAASTHIMKPASERLYATVENELLCMRLAGKVGIPVPATTMGIVCGKRYLLVERYDRWIRGPRQIKRGHQEDFCQALGIYPTAKYEARGGPGLADLFQTIDRHLNRPARARLTLLDSVIFACCIGDTDRHGKNYSVMLTDHSPHLAPGYDFMSALAYQNITRNLAMRIAARNRAEHIERRHWERFAQTVGLAPAATLQRVERLSIAVAEQSNRVAEEIVELLPADQTAISVFSERIGQQALRVAANCRAGPSANSPQAQA